MLPNQPEPDDLLENGRARAGRARSHDSYRRRHDALAYIEDPASLRRGTFDIERLLTGVARKATPLLNGRLQVEPAPADRLLCADEQRLVQALINLIKNAHDHTSPDTAIHVRAVGEPGAWRFEVADAGAGLAPDEEQLVFQPFYKRTESDGTGLGLAIVAGIARAHGGAVAAR